jgi:hypothetical protein
MVMSFNHYFRPLEYQQPSYPSGMAPDVRPLLMWPSYFKKIRMWSFTGEKIFYDHTAEIDVFGFRKTPSAFVRDRAHHLILAGCSFTFGMGVNDDQVFAHRLSRDMPDAAVVNMSRNGGHAQDLLYIWRYFNWQEVIAPRQGTLIYTFIPDHLERIAGSWRNLQLRDPHSARFRESEDGLEFAGTWSESRKWKWIQLLKQLKLDGIWLRLVWWARYSELETAEELFVASLQELKKEYLQKFPQGRFVVTKFPFDQFGLDERSEAKLRRLIQSAGFEVWDFPYEAGSLKNEGRIPGDEHPSSEAHAQFAKLLAHRLRQQK